MYKRQVNVSYCTSLAGRFYVGVSGGLNYTGAAYRSSGMTEYLEGIRDGRYEKPGGQRGELYDLWLEGRYLPEKQDPFSNYIAATGDRPNALNAHVGIFAQYDTRDVTFNASKGVFVKAEAKWYPEWLGNTRRTFGRFTLTFDFYQRLWKGAVLACDLYADATAGTPSWHKMCIRDSPVDRTYPWEHVTREAAEEALRSLTGERLQEPPLFSAKKIEGTRAYELARAGETTRLRKSLITIYEMNIEEFDLPRMRIRVRCSKGTYIRSLAREIGEALQSGAHLRMCIRDRPPSVSSTEVQPPSVSVTAERTDAAPNSRRRSLLDRFIESVVIIEKVRSLGRLVFEHRFPARTGDLQHLSLIHISLRAGGCTSRPCP